MFDRPLLFTASQDIWGYLFNIVGQILLLLVACTSVLAVLFIFMFIIGESIPFFQDRGFTELFASNKWNPTREENPSFGALGQVFGSILVTIAALTLAVPLGLLAAVFLSDIVPFRIRQIVKPIVEVLAAIPSVAYGFFAAVVVAPWLQRQGILREWMHLTSGACGLNGAIMLAIMAVPTIVSVSEDALSAVGRDLREGSYALGATRAETIVRVIMPAAHSGLLAAVILGMMRAIGETMVVLMAAGGGTQLPTPWYDPRQWWFMLGKPIGTMTAVVARETPEAATGSVHFHAMFAVGLVLLVFTFVLNLASEHFVRATRRGRS